MNWYLLIATSKRIQPWPGAEKERGEFAVERQLAALGIEARAPREITFKRQGKRRHADAIVEALCPNYVFANIPDALFFQAMQCRGLSPTVMRLSAGDITGVRKMQDGTTKDTGTGLLSFLDAAAKKQAEAERLIRELEEAKTKAEAREARMKMVSFEKGDLLEVLNGPLAGRMARFKQMVQAAQDEQPALVVEIEGFGGWVPGKLDPLDVRRRA